MFNFWTSCDGFLAERAGIDRHLPPAIDKMPKRQNFFFNNATTALLGGQICARQKHHANSQPPTIIIMAGAGNMLDEKIAWDFDMDAGAIPGHAVSVNRTAMPNSLQGFNGGFDNGPVWLAITRRDKSHTAGIMFHVRAIHTSGAQPAFVPRPAHQIVLGIK